jgi:hypothetical protein
MSFYKKPITVQKVDGVVLLQVRQKTKKAASKKLFFFPIIRTSYPVVYTTYVAIT